MESLATNEALYCNLWMVKYHPQRQQLVNIVSPFDDLWIKETIDWLADKK